MTHILDFNMKSWFRHWRLGHYPVFIIRSLIARSWSLQSKWLWVRSELKLSLACPLLSIVATTPCPWFKSGMIHGNIHQNAILASWTNTLCITCLLSSSGMIFSGCKNCLKLQSPPHTHCHCHSRWLLPFATTCRSMSRVRVEVPSNPAYKHGIGP